MKRLAEEWVGRMIRIGERLAAWRAARRAEAELRAMDPRELRDLGLGRGGIPFAARHGRG